MRTLPECLTGEVSPKEDSELQTYMCHYCYGPVSGFYSFCSDKCKIAYLSEHEYMKTIDDLWDNGKSRY